VPSRAALPADGGSCDSWTGWFCYPPQLWFTYSKGCTQWHMLFCCFPPTFFVLPAKSSSVIHPFCRAGDYIWGLKVDWSPPLLRKWQSSTCVIKLVKLIQLTYFNPVITGWWKSIGFGELLEVFSDSHERKPTPPAHSRVTWAGEPQQGGLSWWT